MREPAPRTIYLKDYTPPAFLISAIDLDVDIREDHALVSVVQGGIFGWVSDSNRARVAIGNS